MLLYSLFLLMIVLLHEGHNNNVYFEAENTEFAEVEAVDDVTLYEGDTKCNILLITFDEDDDDNDWDWDDGGEYFWWMSYLYLKTFI